jgi:hypothetical protein
MNNQVNDQILRIVGGVYLALAFAMPEDAHRTAHAIMMGLADNPEISPEDRRAYRLIALTGGRQDWVEEERPSRFEVITGGAA